MVAGEGCKEGKLREFGKVSCTLLRLNWITSKDLLDGTGTLFGLGGSLDERGVG